MLFEPGEQELISQRLRAGMVSGVSIIVCGHNDKLVYSVYHSEQNLIKKQWYQKCILTLSFIIA